VENLPNVGAVGVALMATSLQSPSIDMFSVTVSFCSNRTDTTPYEWLGNADAEDLIEKTDFSTTNSRSEPNLMDGANDLYLEFLHPSTGKELVNENSNQRA
jgi:hypothetical protein